MENLNRGIIAVKVDSGIFVSWRLLASDDFLVPFNVYRIERGKEPYKVNYEPIVGNTQFFDNYSVDIQTLSYSVVPLGVEVQGEVAVVWNDPFLTIPLKTPEGYRPNDASAADLDGDGNYELVVHMAARGRDNSQAGMTSPPVLHAYKMDGTLLWTINLGANIREGAHYTQFMVYDLDGDGSAEVTCKTADGTIDGKGNVIGNKDSLYVEPDNRQPNEWRTTRFSRGGKAGKILKGPEYLTLFSGRTGEALATVDYIPPRHPETLYPTGDQLTEVWGDGNGNRSDRYLACIAYLDGKNPSLVMARGYYTRAVLAAWDYQNGKLVHRWTFDSEDGTPGNQAYSGQGNHNLSVGDVDGDGCDEIIYGACTIDHNGKGLYSTGFGHGDALHFSDLDPGNPGLEVFNIQERFDDAGMNFREAGSGKVLWKVASQQADTIGGDQGEGPGRGAAFNIDPRNAGVECWVRGAGITGLYNAKGQKISEKTPGSCNFGIWWDGDLQRELLDGNRISKWNWDTESTDLLFVAEGCQPINGTKSNPMLSADLFGDWREELVLPTTNNQALRIYTSTLPTPHRLYTLMHDRVYRLGIAWQNVAYNQPPHTGYYIGKEMELPKKPLVSIVAKNKSN